MVWTCWTLPRSSEAEVSDFEAVYENQKISWSPQTENSGEPLNFSPVTNIKWPKLVFMPNMILTPSDQDRLVGSSCDETLWVSKVKNDKFVSFFLLI